MVSRLSKGQWACVALMSVVFEAFLGVCVQHEFPCSVCVWTVHSRWDTGISSLGNALFWCVAGDCFSETWPCGKYGTPASETPQHMAFSTGRQVAILGVHKVTVDNLAHLLLDKMAAISQMIFSDAFLWIKSFAFWWKFHWSLFIVVKVTITQHWFR